jgi:hypothetical protein
MTRGARPPSPVDAGVDTGNPSPLGGWAGVPVTGLSHRGSVMKAPPLSLRKMTILSGSKNRHTDIGRRLWRTGNKIEAGDQFRFRAVWTSSEAGQLICGRSTVTPSRRSPPWCWDCGARGVRNRRPCRVSSGCMGCRRRQRRRRRTCKVVAGQRQSAPWDTRNSKYFSDKIKDHHCI